MSVEIILAKVRQKKIASIMLKLFLTIVKYENWLVSNEDK